MPPKRKSDASINASTSKKAHVNENHASAVALVNAILAEPEDFTIPDEDDELRRNFVALANYVRTLQGQARDTLVGSGSAAVPAKRSPEELEVAAEKIKKAAVAGIKKQMNWRPSCKTGTAKWCYDGICPDPEVFGVLLGFGGPPTFKMKKMKKEEFQDHIGDISSSVRYSYLYITGKDVNIRWSDTGEFKFSGTYGTSRD